MKKYILIALILLSYTGQAQIYPFDGELEVSEVNELNTPSIETHVVVWDTVSNLFKHVKIKDLPLGGSGLSNPLTEDLDIGDYRIYNSKSGPTVSGLNIRGESYYNDVVVSSQNGFIANNIIRVSNGSVLDNNHSGVFSFLGYDLVGNNAIYLPNIGLDLVNKKYLPVSVNGIYADINGDINVGVSFDSSLDHTIPGSWTFLPNTNFQSMTLIGVGDQIRSVNHIIDDLGGANSTSLATSLGIRDYVDNLVANSGGSNTMSSTSFNPYLSISSTTGQGAIEKLKDELDSAVISVLGTSLQEFTVSTANQTTWVLDNTPNTAYPFRLYIGGLLMRENFDYTLSGNTISFLYSLSTGNQIAFHYNDIASPSSNTPLTDAEIATAYQNEVPQVSAGEITAGTEIELRGFSPSDIKAFVDAHASSGSGVDVNADFHLESATGGAYEIGTKWISGGATNRFEMDGVNGVAILSWNLGGTANSINFGNSTITPNNEQDLGSTNSRFGKGWFAETVESSSGFKITGGTADDFLKANGTIDTNTYITSPSYRSASSSLTMNVSDTNLGVINFNTGTSLTLTVPDQATEPRETGYKVIVNVVSTIGTGVTITPSGNVTLTGETTPLVAGESAYLIHTSTPDTWLIIKF